MSVMALLDAHLEQISLCAASIAELQFPAPKMFTNALLQPHDITTLIRDTEVHERALFTVPQPEPSNVSAVVAARNRRQTTYQAANGGAQGGNQNTFNAPRKNTAVAAALGPDLAKRIQEGGAGAASGPYGYRREAREKGDVDIEVLLEGAEKLCNAYSIPGSKDKIHAFRRRYRELAGNIAHYESRIADQAEQLGSMNRSRAYSHERDADEDEDEPAADMPQDLPVTAQDMRREEAEVKELERKKRMLEERVGSMEKDITGVLR